MKSPPRIVTHTAVITVVVTLLGIVVGALVTTYDAGMAFRDWPGSDGYNMLLYPVWRATGDKLIEHGHRLAGMAIGIVSLALAVVVFRYDSRRWMRWLAVAIVAAVVAQGLLGGARVLMDRRTLAMLHGNFASIVVTLMGITA